MRRTFYTLDVFTQTPYEGNPLAVVMDATGLDRDVMQLIAREFNLSETVFVTEPRDPVHTAQLRIFTPERELPFAGHPTIGTAILIAQLRAPDMIAHQDLGIVLEEEVGNIACTVRHLPHQSPYARFQLPKLPHNIGSPPSLSSLALILSLSVDDIGYGAYVPSCFSAGNGFIFVPVRDRARLTRAAPNYATWDRLLDSAPAPSVFLYTQVEGESPHAFHARMFSPKLGVREDPATGSAAAAFAGVLHQAGIFENGAHIVHIRQGEDMGRPSDIYLHVTLEEERLVEVSIGGSAVMMQHGTLAV